MGDSIFKKIICFGKDLPMNSNDFDVDFESLKENRDWLEIHALYQNNIKVFSEIIKKVMNNYGMTQVQARDTVLYELMSSNYGKQHKKMLYSLNKFKWSVIYIATFFSLFVSGMASLFIIQKKRRVHLLFEEMFSKDGWNKRFYSYITEILVHTPIKTAIFYTHPGITKDILNTSIEQWDGYVINRRYSSLFFCFKELSWIIYKDLFFIRHLFKLSNNLNVTYVYLRIIRKYLLYSSQIKNIEADIMISAGDYYWNPMKYFVYKRNIDHIILLQHNFKNEYLHNRLFQYCDIYYAHSDQAIKKLEGISFANKYSIGSFQLIPYLKNDGPEIYDIMFINQTVNDNLKDSWPYLDQKKLIDSYYILIENFQRLLEKYPSYNAIYVAKRGHLDSEPSLTVKERLHHLPNIKFMNAYGPETFELIKKSKLIINMYSSVGFESYGLDKRVLWINYNRCCDVFKYDTEEESLHTLISDSSYEIFEERVNYLLAEDIDIDIHYKKLKEKYMNVQENPAKIITNKISEILKNKNSLTTMNLH